MTLFCRGTRCPLDFFASLPLSLTHTRARAHIHTLTFLRSLPHEFWTAFGYLIQKSLYAFLLGIQFLSNMQSFHCWLFVYLCNHEVGKHKVCIFILICFIFLCAYYIGMSLSLLECYASVGD